MFYLPAGKISRSRYFEPADALFLIKLTGMITKEELQQEDTIEQFEALFAFATIGIIVTDQSGIIINFNRCAETQFGYTKEEIAGRPVEELIPKQYQKTHQEHREKYYMAPHPRSMGAGRDLYAKRKDNSVFPVEVSLSHYMSRGKIFVIAFVIDITVRKNSEQMVLQQKQELEEVTKRIRHFNTELEQKVQDRTKMLQEALVELEKSRSELSEALETEKELSDLKSRFVTLASHEFRTPLSTILSSAYLLDQYTPEDSKTKKHIQRIKSAVAGMKSILEDFLSLGKLEEGLIQIKNEEISAAQCFQDIETLIEDLQQIRKPGQIIEFEHSGDRDIIIDRGLFRNIGMNLISNAIKFSPDKAKIEIGCHITDTELKFTVKDNGLGISEEDQQHLFKRFFRGRNVSNIQGTGLGLHIIAKYLELMNGRIELHSELEKGSTFTVFLHLT
jgi:PAS domain S-box-containing protein